MDQIKALNDLIEQLRKGEIQGTIEVKVETKDKTNTIRIRPKGDSDESNIRNIILTNPDVSYLNIKQMNLSGSDFSGLSAKKVDLSDSIIEDSDFSGADVTDSDFSGAMISETNMNNVYNINPAGAYLTGSVNIGYGVPRSVASPNDYAPMDQSSTIPKSDTPHQHFHAPKNDYMG